MIRAQLKEGRIREVHQYVEGGGGYFFFDGTDEQLLEDLSLWDPYVLFEVHKTVPIEKASEIALNALKKRARKA